MNHHLSLQTSVWQNGALIHSLFFYFSHRYGETRGGS